MARRRLTIDLGQEGGELVRTYYLRDESIARSRQRIETIGQGYRVGQAVGIGALIGLLTRHDLPELKTHLAGGELEKAGEMLFEILFGPSHAVWSPVLKAAFRSGPDDDPRPPRYPLRVRITTADDKLGKVLFGLPWRATMHRGRFLCDDGWTFEICAGRAEGPEVVYRAPGSVLIVAPEDATDIETAEHITELEELFEEVAEGFTKTDDFCIARSPAAIDDARRKTRWDLVYFYGHGMPHKGQLHLKTGPEPRDALLVRDLCADLRKSPPRAVFLNACLSGQAGWHSAGWHLSPEVPVVVVNVTLVFVPQARRFALDWLRGWLRGGPEPKDPVEAAHQRIGRSYSLLGWGIPLVHAHYDTWTTLRRPEASALDRQGLEKWLDRNDQRALMSKHVRELSQHRTQRVEAAIAFGLPGNALASASEQLRDYIEQYDGQWIHILPVKIPFYLQSGQRAPLARQLRRIAGAVPDFPLRTVLLGQAPRASAGAARIVWLDWGVLGGKPSYGDDICAWLDFLRDEIAPACPEEIRVVAFLAVEATAASLSTIGDGLNSLVERGRYSTLEMDLTCLSALESVKMSHIRKYLAAHIKDREIVEPLVEGIYAETKGHYEETTKLLEEGHRSGWRPLLRRLKAPPPPSRKF